MTPPEVVCDWAGSVDAVRWALERAEESGRLVSVEPLSAGPGRVVVRVVLRQAAIERAPGPRQLPRQRPRHRWEYVAACSMAVLAAAGALVWLAVEVVMLAARWLGAHVPQVLGVLGALLVLVWICGRVGVCPGVHCPGCRHR